MATVEDLLNCEASQIGVCGTDNPYNTWIWGQHVYDPNTYPWCAAFQSWCMSYVDIDMTPTASAAGVLNQFPRVGDDDVQPGDVVCFNWDGRSNTGWMDHVGIVEWFDHSTGYFGTIEGNTGGGEGCVMRCTRYNYGNYFTAFSRPPYSNDASEPKKDESSNNGKSPLHGIDISSYQAGIDLAQVPCDFAIIKATQGTGYYNDACADQIESARSNGKKYGLYHFADGGNAIAEADYFVNTIHNRVGEAILVLDWESDAVKRGTDWARMWLDRVYDRTGVRPLIYMSNSVVNSYDWTDVARDYPLWNAAYYAGYEPMGYQDNPPMYGGTGAWDRATIYQYTSSGHIDGWGSSLDLNIFYGNSSDWDVIAGAKEVYVEPLDKKERKMQFIFQPNDHNALCYYDGNDVHYLHHPDDVVALNMCYQQCFGRDIPVFKLGQDGAPWADRFLEAVTGDESGNGCTVFGSAKWVG